MFIELLLVKQVSFSMFLKVRNSFSNKQSHKKEPLFSTWAFQFNPNPSRFNIFAMILTCKLTQNVVTLILKLYLTHFPSIFLIFGKKYIYDILYSTGICLYLIATEH